MPSLSGLARREYDLRHGGGGDYGGGRVNRPSLIARTILNREI